MFDVVAIGEMLVDFTQERNNADGYPIVAAHPGGAVANYLAPLAKYGLYPALIAKVGNDAFGRLLSTSLQSAGINSKFVSRTSSAFTTLAFVTRDEYGEREFSFVQNHIPEFHRSLLYPCISHSLHMFQYLFRTAL